MATKGKGNLGGRPRKEIDFTIFEELCKIHCTKAEICGVLGITDKTLDRLIREHYGRDAGFSAIYEKYAAFGKESLRRAQLNLAKTNATMAIWLGKQWLGQREDGGVEQTIKIELGAAEKLAE